MSVSHIKRTEINLGERAAPLVIRVNRRAKRLILKVDPIAGEIHVTAPTKRAMPEALAFANERIDWIVSQLNEKLQARPFMEGDSIPFQGAPHRIVRNGGPRAPVRVDHDLIPVIRVGGEPEHLNRRLVDWMKSEARRELTARVDRYCTQLDRKRRSIRVRDTRTRWGSCSSDGALSFSWRLIMAPPDILDYVAAHECVHLIHMNHSPAFWRQVAALGVDARAAENWFEDNGAELFTYGVQTKQAA